MFKKYDTSAIDKTHGLVDATILDALLPNTPLDATGSMVRSAVYFGAGWLGATKKHTGNFSF